MNTTKTTANTPTATLATVREIEVIRENTMPDGASITDARAAARIVAELIGNKTKEHFLALHLDTKNRVTSFETVSVGTLDASLVHPRETFRGALLAGAAAVIVAHNHPSGDPTPSAADLQVTRRLEQAGVILGIPILDHIIVGAAGTFTSLRELGHVGGAATIGDQVREEGSYVAPKDRPAFFMSFDDCKEAKEELRYCRLVATKGTEEVGYDRMARAGYLRCQAARLGRIGCDRAAIERAAEYTLDGNIAAACNELERAYPGSTVAEEPVRYVTNYAGRSFFQRDRDGRYYSAGIQTTTTPAGSVSRLVSKLDSGAWLPTRTTRTAYGTTTWQTLDAQPTLEAAVDAVEERPLRYAIRNAIAESDREADRRNEPATCAGMTTPARCTNDATTTREDYLLCDECAAQFDDMIRAQQDDRDWLSHGDYIEEARAAYTTQTSRHDWLKRFIAVDGIDYIVTERRRTGPTMYAATTYDVCSGGSHVGVIVTTPGRAVVYLQTADSIQRTEHRTFRTAMEHIARAVHG